MQYVASVDTLHNEGGTVIITLSVSTVINRIKNRNLKAKAILYS